VTGMPTPVRVVDPLETRVVLVGVGGTGGYCLQQLARLLYGLKAEREEVWIAPPLARSAREEPEPVPEVLLCDGDTVSLANLRRQYFLSRDVSKNKALVLAERYGAAYGLKFSAYPHYLSPATDFTALVPEGSIVVGCVDNAATRRLLHEQLSSYTDVVYLDAGNAAVEIPEDGPLTRKERIRIRDSGWEGQVLCGVRRRGQTSIPFPAEQIPDLIEDDGERLPSEVPCGRVVVSNPQRALTNTWAAITLYSYLTGLLSEGTILHRMTLFCARRGYAKSYPALDVMDEVVA
jgi:hypothetical protein